MYGSIRHDDTFALIAMRMETHMECRDCEGVLIYGGRYVRDLGAVTVYWERRRVRAVMPTLVCLISLRLPLCAVT